MNLFKEQIEYIEKNFTEIHPSAEVVLDLKYATNDNFMKLDVYAGFDRLFLSIPAAKMFQDACELLKKNHPQLQFKVWDGLRPRRVQAQFFDFLKGTPFQSYVAAPEPGSLHNYGMALDVTLQDKNGAELDMGTGFDDFRDLAQPKLESQFLKSGELTQEQLENRMILRQVMESCGFKVLEHEWWHFNAMAKDKVYGHFPVLE